MDKNSEGQIMARLMAELEKASLPKGKFADFHDKLYGSVDISKSNFNMLKFEPENTPMQNKIAFVDGSNVSLISAPNFCLGFIRVASLIYLNNKRVESIIHEYFVLVNSSSSSTSSYSTSSSGKSLKYNLEFFSLTEDLLGFADNPLVVDAFDQKIMVGNDRANISKLVEIARSIAEIKAADKLCESLEKNSAIVMDGILKPKLPHEAEFFSSLFSLAKEKEISICGLAKTTDLLTDTGDSLVACLNIIIPDKDNAWYYWPLVKNNNPCHPVEIIIVKLHEKSDYIFRFELSRYSMDQLNQILQIMMLNSVDPLFIGYPYGLIDAHKSCKIDKNEASRIRLAFKLRVGDKWKYIEPSLRSSDAHDLLDTI